MKAWTLSKHMLRMFGHHELVFGIGTAHCRFSQALFPEVFWTHWGRDKITATILQRTFKYIFVNKNVWLSIKSAPHCIPKCPVNNISVLVQIMAWCRSGNKRLPELMMASLLTHICVTRPRWVKRHVIARPWWRGYGVNVIMVTRAPFY